MSEWDLLKAYIRNFFATWVGWTGGGASVLLAAIAASMQAPLPAACFWVSSVLCFIGVSYIFWRREHLRVSELVTPRLELLFEPGLPPYLHEVMDDSGRARLIRVGAKNISGKTIEDVHVDLAMMRPDYFSCLPIPLQAMHHKKGPLAPGETRFIDVINRTGHGEMHVMHTVGGLNTNVLLRNYDLRICAHGRDCSCQRDFEIRIEDGRLPELVPVPDTLAGSTFFSRRARSD